MDQLNNNGNGKQVAPNGYHPNGVAKHAGGRKSSYKDEYCVSIVEFFCSPLTRSVLIKRITHPDGKITEEFEERGGILPMFSQYARTIGVTTKCMNEWCVKYPEFSKAHNECKELQKNHLIQNGVNGNYNAAFGIFTAKNITDMRDQPTTVINNESHVHHTSIKIENLNESELIDVLTGRTNGHITKSA